MIVYDDCDNAAIKCRQQMLDMIALENLRYYT